MKGVLCLSELSSPIGITLVFEVNAKNRPRKKRDLPDLTGNLHGFQLFHQV